MKWERSKEIKRESKKRVVSVRGNVCVLMCSPEVWERPQAHGLECPSLRRNTFVLETPLQFYGFFGWVFFLCVLKETGRECTPFIAKLNPFVCKKLCVWRRHKFSVG